MRSCCASTDAKYAEFSSIPPTNVLRLLKSPGYGPNPGDEPATRRDGPTDAPDVPKRTVPSDDVCFIPLSTSRNRWTDTDTFRSNPETLRTMLQMSSVMNEMGVGPAAGGFPGMGGGLGGPGGFGGAANPTVAPNPATNTTTPGTTPSTTGTTDTTGTTTGSPPPNPFMDPAMMQQLMGAFGGSGGGGLGGGLGGGGLFGAPATPADTRPPEERFQTQLQVSLLWDNQTID